MDRRLKQWISCFPKTKSGVINEKRSKCSFKQFQIFQHVSVSLPVEEKHFFTPSLLSMWAIIKQDEQTRRRTNLSVGRSGWTSWTRIGQDPKPLLPLFQLFIFFNLEEKTLLNYTKTLLSGCFSQWMFYKSKSWTVIQHLYSMKHRRENRQPAATKVNFVNSIKWRNTKREIRLLTPVQHKSGWQRINRANGL